MFRRLSQYHILSASLHAVLGLTIALTLPDSPDAPHGAVGIGFPYATKACKSFKGLQIKSFFLA